jgi:hypothetical protein
MANSITLETACPTSMPLSFSYAHAGVALGKARGGPVVRERKEDPIDDLRLAKGGLRFRLQA